MKPGKGKKMRLLTAMTAGAVLVSGMAGAACAAPGVPVVEYFSAFGGSEKNDSLKIRVTSQDDQTDGYRVVLYDRKGKALQKLSGTTTDIGTKKKGTALKRIRGYYSWITLSKTSAESLYKIGVEAFTKGKPAEYSKPAVFYALPQPVIANADENQAIKSGDITGQSIKIKWKKVSGADSYTVFVARMKKLTYNSKKISKLKFEKARKLGAKKTAFTLKKYNKKKLDTKKYYYYIKVVSASKAGKNRIASPDGYFVYGHDYHK